MDEYKLLIELLHVYDGWSVGVDHNNKLHNRWKPEDGARYKAAQDFIDLSGGVFSGEHKEN